MSEEVIGIVEKAPTSSFEDIFAQWDDRLNRLELYCETEPNRERYKYPEWWNEEDSRAIWNLPNVIKESDADLATVTRYYDMYSRSAILGANISGRELDHPMIQFIYNIGSDVAGNALAAEPIDGTLHVAILESLEQGVQSSHEVVSSRLEALTVAYGVQTSTELLGIGGENDYEKRLRAVLRHPNVIRRIRYADEERTKDDEPWSQQKIYQRDWMNKVVSVVSGMRTEESQDYTFSASRRGSDESIISVVEKFDHFGVDRIRLIAAKTGIHGLEAYTIPELERMEAFAKDPSQVAEQLVDRDVTVVMANRVGDHNGVLNNVADMFEDSNERTLFFEIENLADIYRYMIKLDKVGIKPSTLALASHSAPGQFYVSDSRPEHSKDRYTSDLAAVAARKVVAIANVAPDLEPGLVGYSMHGMKGMARLVEDLMQPSRGINDDPSDIDHKKIIFQACYAASEVDVRDIGESGERFTAAMESVISQLGKDLAASGVKSQVDIYGADTGIQMHADEKSVYYSSQPTFFGENRPKTPAKVVRVSGGNVTTEDILDIKLRR